MGRNTNALLRQRFDEGFHVCVGLDSDAGKVPGATGKARGNAIFEFNRGVVDVTAALAAAYKPNLAFYEKLGAQGHGALDCTIAYILRTYPHIPVILDAKRGDIANTAEAYAEGDFGEYKADAMTLSPYMGEDAIAPYLAYADKMAFVLCRTSNKSAAQLQDRVGADGLTLYEAVAAWVEVWNRAASNVGLVMGCTSEKTVEEMQRVRRLTGPEMIYLVPGIGAQGGDLAAVFEGGGRNVLINSSRGIIFARDPGAAAKELHEQITALL